MIQDDDGNAFKVNGQRLKLFLDHHKALDEEVNVIDLVDPVLMFKKSQIGQKGQEGPSYLSSTRPYQLTRTSWGPLGSSLGWPTYRSADSGPAPVRPSFGARPP